MRKLFVFDLDFTLWNTGGVWVDCTQPPYSLRKGKILDANGRRMELYPESLAILELLHQHNYPVAIASRTEEPSWARQLIKLFDIERFFDYMEIYPNSKLKHLSRISEHSGVDFEHMIFFDDEHRNIVDAQSIGVTAVHVSNGIHLDMVKQFL